MATIMLVLTIFWNGEAQQPLRMEERYDSVKECAVTGHMISNKLIQHPKVTEVVIQCFEGETT